ncbi:sensor histidine kinase [Hamadaea tsunoensis]|uniref:sensor histidine kinase n=1 Tax=Hamadaea tsunoensis TaxID=53368 RepID=UPI000405A280|nr:ATP-binding protein [Hamadaea tsunoensis]
MSFRLRVLLLIVFLVATSSAATAWLTLRQAGKDLTASVVASQHDVTEASTRLAAYGHLHGGWQGVEAVVSDLARSLGQRVRVTTGTDTVLADSDLLAGHAARPAPATSSPVDARPVIDFGLVHDDYNRMMFTLGAVDAYTRNQRYAACLSQARIPAQAVPAKGFALVVPVDPVAATGAGCAFPNTPVTNPAAADRGKQCLRATDPAGCLRGLFADAISPAAPPQLHLYLGVRDEPTHQLSTGSIAVAAGAVTIAAILAGFLLSRRVLRPIGALTEASRRLGAGSAAARVPENGRDELGELARTFNRMAESLSRSREQQRRLIGDVAHELRTPLANLRGYLEALADGVIPPTPELFASLHEETLLQQRIVDDLQELALAEAGALAYHRAAVDLADLAETTRAAFLPQAETAGVRVRVEAVPLTVPGDPDRLRQVLGNLVRNAVAATPDGGTITIGVRPAGGRAIVEVADTGRGIAAADLPHVFDRFWRADAARARSTGGSGLGLAIAREIVTAHDGTMSVVSSEGAGTVFTVELPA